MEQEVVLAVGRVFEVLTGYGINAAGAVLILVTGWWAGGWARRAVQAGLGRIPRIDEMLRGFFALLAKYAVWAVTVIAVLDRFGIQTTSFVAVLGAAGLAIGLALQGTLTNVAAGVMLLLLRPFKVGDTIEVGAIAGTVRGVGLFTTELVTGDNVQIIMPNNGLWGTAIKNFSALPTRRCDLTVGIAYEDDVERAIAIIKELAAADSRVLADPPPFVAVANLGESSVDLVIRLWCVSADYWPLKFDTIKATKQALDAAGISIPFPQRVLHVVGPAPLP